VGTKTFRCPAGQWTTLVSNFGTGYPKSFRIELSGDGSVAGEYVEKRHWWIFPQRPKTGPLAPVMTFERYWVNAIYSIKIRPEHGIVATVT
jgi:hypothetical protein